MLAQGGTLRCQASAMSIMGKTGLSKQPTWCRTPLPSLTLAGLKNWVVAEDVVFKRVAVPWSPEHQLQRPQLTRQVLRREDLAAFSWGSPLPRYLYLASNQTNAWGHQRGYRIQIHSPPGIHVPLESSMERALSWGR